MPGSGLGPRQQPSPGGALLQGSARGPRAPRGLRLWILPEAPVPGRPGRRGWLPCEPPWPALWLSVPAQPQSSLLLCYSEESPRNPSQTAVPHVWRRRMHPRCWCMPQRETPEFGAWGGAPVRCHREMSVHPMPVAHREICAWCWETEAPFTTMGGLLGAEQPTSRLFIHPDSAERLEQSASRTPTTA